MENALSLASGQAPVAPLRLIWELGLLPYTAIARTLPDRHLIIVSHHAASYLPASSNLSPRRYRWGHSQGSEAAAFPSYDATTRTEISGMENTALYYSTYRSKLEPFWGDCHEIPPGDSCWVTCMMPAGCSLLLRPLTRCPPRAFQLSLPPIGSGPKPAQRTLGGEGTGTTSQYHHHQQLCAE